MLLILCFHITPKVVRQIPYGTIPPDPSEHKGGFVFDEHINIKKRESTKPPRKSKYHHLEAWHRPRCTPFIIVDK